MCHTAPWAALLFAAAASCVEVLEETAGAPFVVLRRASVSGHAYEAYVRAAQNLSEAVAATEPGTIHASLAAAPGVGGAEVAWATVYADDGAYVLGATNAATGDLRRAVAAFESEAPRRIEVHGRVGASVAEHLAALPGTTGVAHFDRARVAEIRGDVADRVGGAAAAAAAAAVVVTRISFHCEGCVAAYLDAPPAAPQPRPHRALGRRAAAPTVLVRVDLADSEDAVLDVLDGAAADDASDLVVDLALEVYGTPPGARAAARVEAWRGRTPPRVFDDVVAWTRGHAAAAYDGLL